MAKPIPSIRPLKGKDADRMIKYLQEHPPDPEWVKRRLEEDRKLLRDLNMREETKDIKPSCGLKCDICKEGEWGGAIYLSTTYWEFVCGARLCSGCSAVLEATMDELASQPVSELMREENWGGVPPADPDVVASLMGELATRLAEEEDNENS